MDAAAAHSLYDLLHGDRFSLVYCGGFSDVHTASLVALGEATAEAMGRDRTHQHRLAFIMVEAYQNIVRHKAAGSSIEGFANGQCLFALRCSATVDEVVAIDPVEAGEALELESALRRLGDLDLGQLKELFLTRLREGTRTARGGAGLGLIEMARRSANALRYRLLPLDALHRLFVLHITVGGAPSHSSPFETIRRMHSDAVALGLVAACRCSPSAAVREAVLRLLERELEGAESRTAQRAFLSGADWLEAQDLAADAVMALLRDGEGLALLLAVSGGGARIDALRSQLADVQGLPPAVLERRYRDALLGRTGPGPSRDAGLLELVRQSRGPLILDVRDEAARMQAVLLVRLR